MATHLLRNAFDKLTRPPLVTLTAGLIVVLCLALVFTHLLNLPALQGSGGHTYTGDYLAFYSGASLVESGAGTELYDLNQQQQLQRSLVGDQGWDGWHAYINPPALAVLLSLTDPLGFHASFYAFNILCVLLFFGAAVRLKRHLPNLT